MPEVHVEVRLKDVDAAEYITRAEVRFPYCFTPLILMVSRSKTRSIPF